MAFNLRNRSFLKLLDFSQRDLKYVLDLARDLKRAKYAGAEVQRLKGKNIALILRKASKSARSRCPRIRGVANPSSAPALLAASAICSKRSAVQPLSGWLSKDSPPT